MIWKKVSYGEPIQRQEIKLIPQSEAIGMDFPFGRLVWNRPVAILVETLDGAKRIPIVDITRMISLLLWSLTVAFSFIWITTIRREWSGKNE